MNQPKVSVRLMVYNNEPFIRDALEGIFIQQTNFPYEVVIGDDFSQDGTMAILKEFKERYPDKVRLLDRPIGGDYHTRRKRLGRILNFTDIVDHCRGKYIAILDGDDYWTDPFKLQTQVDFLEQNPDFSITFHQAKRIYVEDGKIEYTNPDQPEVTDASYLLKLGWHMFSPTIVFRKSDLPEWPEWVNTIQSMDYVVQCMLTSKGQKIKYFDKAMCDYRTHADNISSKINEDYLEILNRNQHLLTCIRTLQENQEYIDIIDHRLLDTKTQRFYHYRAKVKKSWDDWKTIWDLGRELDKFKITNIFKKLALKS